MHFSMGLTGQREQPSPPMETGTVMPIKAHSRKERKKPINIM